MTNKKHEAHIHMTTTEQEEQALGLSSGRPKASIEVKDPIQLPAAVLLREVRIRLVPALVFGLAVLLAAWLWRNKVGPQANRGSSQDHSQVDAIFMSHLPEKSPSAQPGGSNTGLLPKL